MLESRNQDRGPITFEGLELRRLMSVGLPFGGQAPGEISQIGEVDSYKFTVLQSGATVELNTNATDIDRLFSAKFVLKNDKGVAVDKWFNHASRREQNLSAGTYTLEVSDQYSKRRGQYEIGLEGISPFSPNPIKLKTGSIVSGETTSPLDVKQYTFTVAGGTNVQINTSAIDIDRLYSAQFRLYDSKGGLKDTWFNKAGRLEQNLAAGTYMIEVNDQYHLRRGTFKLGVEVLSAPFSADVKTLRNKVKASGTLSDGIDVREFKMLATTGTLNFTTTSAAIDRLFGATFTLYDSKGAKKASWVGNKTVKVSNLTAGQTYMLKIQDQYLARRGTFSVTAIGIKA